MLKYTESCPLHFAVQERQRDRIQELLRSGTKVDSRDQRGTTPLMVAAKWGYNELIELLLNAGANPNAKDRGNRVEYGWRTPLYHACMVGRFGTVKLLLEKGANPDALAQYGHSPLSSVIRMRGNKQIVMLLLEHGASPNGPPKCWEPPLVPAASNNDFALLAELLRRRADPNRMGLSGDLALPSTTSADCARMLLDHGAQINLRDAHEESALLKSLGAGNVELVRLYVQAGANVNTRDKYGYTPLMRLAECPRTDVASVLIEAGAEINDIPVKNCTALDWIANFDSIRYRDERRNLVQYLRSQGAKTAKELIP